MLVQSSQYTKKQQQQQHGVVFNLYPYNGDRTSRTTTSGNTLTHCNHTCKHTYRRKKSSEKHDDEINTMTQHPSKSDKQHRVCIGFFFLYIYIYYAAHRSHTSEPLQSQLLRLRRLGTVRAFKSAVFHVL